MIIIHTKTAPHLRMLFFNSLHCNFKVFSIFLYADEFNQYDKPLTSIFVYHKINYNKFT